MFMPAKRKKTPTGLLLSGGLDSCILLCHMARHGLQIQPFYIRSQLHWEQDELRAIQAFLRTVGNNKGNKLGNNIRAGNRRSKGTVPIFVDTKNETVPNIEPLVVLDMPLKDLYGRHWSTDGRDVPDAHTPDNAVYLPGRNALLIIKASIWCRLNGIGELAIAVLGSNPFGDATAEFFADLESALERATAGRVRLVRPFARFDKRQVMRLGRGLPLQLTFSCISPIKGSHCGVCNKCAERQKAFRFIDMDDPTHYAKGCRL
jgi:7-cyano-7-deazaguanine synthase